MRKLLVFLLVCVIFTGCGVQEKAVPLTPEEIEQVNAAFDCLIEVPQEGQEEPQLQVNPISCFFTSFYSEPARLHLGEFLMYCPVGSTLEDGDAEEYRKVLEAVEVDPELFPLPSDYVVPVHRYRKAEVSALLTQYAGITVEDLVTLEGTVYLEEYDSFYNFTSDFGPGIFVCAGGEKAGDTLRLWSEEGEDGLQKVLIMKEENGRYLIQSFQQE